MKKVWERHHPHAFPLHYTPVDVTNTTMLRCYTRDNFSFMLFQAPLEMKNLNLQVTLIRSSKRLLVQKKVWERRSRHTAPLYTARGGARGVPGGATAHPKFCLTPPVAPPNFPRDVMSLH